MDYQNWIGDLLLGVFKTDKDLLIPTPVHSAAAVFGALYAIRYLQENGQLMDGCELAGILNDNVLHANLQRSLFNANRFFCKQIKDTLSESAYRKLLERGIGAIGADLLASHDDDTTVLLVTHTLSNGLIFSALIKTDDSKSSPKLELINKFIVDTFPPEICAASD